jgi:hypothetical protein
MAEKKIIELEVKNNLGSLKSQLREAQAEVAKLSEQFGATSREAAEAARRAAELKDQIEDAKALTDAFNPDAKFKAIGAALGGVASGFAAYQGALGLVGVESKKVEEQLLKVQSAMALAEGINGITSSIDSFKNLGSVIKNNVVSAFGSLRAALISTGIGALAVILGSIIANWKEFSKAITDTFPGFSKVTDFFKNFSQVASGTINSVVAGFKTIGQVLGNIFSGDFSKAYNNAKKLGENMATAYNQGYDKKDKELKTKQSIDNQKFEIDLMKAKGKNVLNAQLELQRKELSLLQKGSDEYKAKLIEIEESKTAIREKAEQDREARIAKAQELAEKRAQELQKKKDEFAKKQAQDLEDSEKMRLKPLSLGDPAKEAREKGDKQLREDYKTSQEKAKLDKENAEREKQLAEEVKNKKIQMGQQAFGILSDLSSLFADGNEADQRKAFQLSKAANLGLAIMNTANAVTGALAEPSIVPGERFFKAALAGATGGINIAKIAATQFQSSGSGGGGDTATSTPTAPRTPSFDIIQAQPQMQLGALQQQPIKAYVVSGEVSTAQALDRNRVRNATF